MHSLFPTVLLCFGKYMSDAVAPYGFVCHHLPLSLISRGRRQISIQSMLGKHNMMPRSICCWHISYLFSVTCVLQDKYSIHSWECNSTYRLAFKYQTLVTSVILGQSILFSVNLWSNLLFTLDNLLFIKKKLGCYTKYLRWIFIFLPFSVSVVSEHNQTG